MKPQVTLAMPVYNVEKYVERALLSALNQSFESMEIIVVNDGTPDGSMDIVRRTMAQHPRGSRVRIIEHAQNIGLGAARNTAIDNADGEYIYFMDSDDEITSDCISTMMAAMQETEVDFVAASVSSVYKDKTKHGVLPDKIITTTSNNLVARAYYIDKLLKRYSMWNKLYRLSFLKENNIRCVPYHLCEDLWFTFQLVMHAQSCRTLSAITYFYYTDRLDSICNVDNTKLSLRAAQNHTEYITQVWNYAINYIDCDFYPFLVKHHYRYALGMVQHIYDSSAVPQAYKYDMVKYMLRYPCGLRQVLRMPVRTYCYHLLMWAASRLPIPHLGLKIFVVRAVNAVARRIFSIVY